MMNRSRASAEASSENRPMPLIGDDHRERLGKPGHDRDDRAEPLEIADDRRRRGIAGRIARAGAVDRARRDASRAATAARWPAASRQGAIPCRAPADDDA